MSRLKYTAEALAYYQAYKQMMLSPKERTKSLRQKLQELIFAIVDPTCPLHCHVERDIPLSIKDAADLLGDSFYAVRNAMQPFSGPLGLLDVKGSQTKLRPAITGNEELQTIIGLRLQLEIAALTRLHRLSSLSKKQNALDALRVRAFHLNATREFARKYDADELRRLIATDPTVGAWAEEFWREDRELHLAAPRALGLDNIAEMLRIMLRRSRLNGANRATILIRIPNSIEQHEAIIAAVAAAPSSTSDSKIAAAVANHLASSSRDFGLGESQFAENLISNRKAFA